MTQMEIPREDWKAFFEDLSREHETGLVTVEVRGQPIPEQEAIRQQPLLGISYEEKGSGRGRIDIMTGSDSDNNTTHTVSAPSLVTVEKETATGDIDTLLIASAYDAPETLVHFLSAN